MTAVIDRYRRNLSPDVMEENKEDITLLWLEKSIDDSENSQYIQTSLFELNTFVQFYTDPQLCIDYIRTIRNEKIFLITGGLVTEEVLSEIHPLLMVHAIFIFPLNPSEQTFLLNDYPKVIGIFTELASLIESVQTTIHLASKHMIAFSLFDQQEQKTTRDLSKNSASFLWNQLLVDALKQMPQTEDAKRDMLDRCSDYYRTNRVELKRIELFHNSYTSDRAIEWYTRDSFVYRLLNKALRTEDIDLLYLFRFYIIDLCSQLEQESKRKTVHTEIYALYRGQQIPTEELNKLIANVGVLVSVNGFFSTTRDSTIAKGFVAGASNTDEMKTVLFEIKANSSLEKIVFADVDKYSHIGGEQEVLFSLGSVFKIDTVQWDSHQQVWKIEMTATDDGSKNVEEYINSIRQEIDDISPTILFGALLVNEMGQIDKAEKYFDMLLRTLPKDHRDIADIYDQIANIFVEKRNLNMALENYLCAYEIRRSRFDSNDIHIANSLHNLGYVHKQRGEYDQAMSCYKQVLAIDEKHYPNDHANKAHTMICIGMLYDVNGEYNFALDYMMKAYEMYQTLFPIEHPYISSSLWNIGGVYEHKSDYDRAMQFYHSGFEMDERILANDHPDFKKNLNRIAQLYIKKCDYASGLSYFQQKLTHQKDLLGKNHPRVAYTLMKIGDMMEDSNGRINYYRQALTILEICATPDYPARIICLQMINTIELKNGLIEEGIKNFLKILSIQQQTLTKNHPDIGCTLQQIGQLHFEMKNTSEALKFLKKSLKIYQTNYPESHDNITKIVANIHNVEEIIRQSN
ncbi:unnamed protein product [Rotaria socialis]|uniref:NAD(P)(+)--arginine ADP-ribosyltransferase n=1 Tax=Rotaria socialis TaxID=392032 RepID=A0A817NDX9_9BILA|nr:unnamed protein product [Rotaria socialis]CAF4235283.1 unnamed protein product [Rotaria socialis]